MKGTIRLFSTSTIHGSSYLDYAEAAIVELFGKCRNVTFVPYARPGGLSHEEYYATARDKFAAMGIRLNGLHHAANPQEAIHATDGLFIGGGNTFVLLRELYANKLLDSIRTEVANGMPYMGTSAGSNVAGQTICTTNDMPIVYPPAFDALGLVPFNLNPHYLDPDPNSTHKGETRETRIKEFHVFNSQPVIGLREGSWLTVNNGNVVLEGIHTARIFKAGESPYEVAPGDITTHIA